MIESTKKVTTLIAVYGRVSTSNQENEGTIETQLAAVNQFAQKNGFVIIKQYIDNGWSGDSLARPALDQLRMDAKKKLWQAVLIYDPDRLARRGAWQEVVIEELRDLEIDVLFVTIPQAKNDEDKIMYKMRGVFSEYERMKINDRFRLGKVRKAQDNHIIVSEAAYGYTFIRKNGKKGDQNFHQGYYEINKREAQIVLMIFTWVADNGLTLRAIVRKLQELRIDPRKSKRGVWSTSTLSTLLRNKTYIGIAHYGASYAVIPVNPLKKETYKKIKKTSRRMKPESEWIKITSPKIISEDLFNRVQERLASNFQMSVRNTKNEYLLSHRIWCPCGCRRAGEGPKQGKHLYYRCTSRVKSFPLLSSCSEKGINARIADELVWKKVFGLMSSPELLSKQIEQWLSNRHTDTRPAIINIEENKKEIAKLKIQEERYAKAYGTGLITLEQLKEYTTPLKEKTSLLYNQISKAELECERLNEKALPQLSEIKIFTKHVYQTLQNLKFEAKQAIVRNIIDRVVGTKTELQVYGFIPITTNINVFTINRHGVNITRHEHSSIPFNFSIKMPSQQRLNNT